MDRLINGLKNHAAAMDSTQGQVQWGTVTSVDPTRPAVKVMMHPEEVLSGWLPVTVPSAGAGSMGLFMPQVGAQALLVPDLGDSRHPVVIGYAHNDAMPPLPVPAANGTGGTPNTTTTPQAGGEIIFVAFGSVVRLAASGAIYLLPGAGTVFVDGNLVCNGDVSDRHGSLDRLRQAYDAHKHPGVTVGSGMTGTTDHVDPE